MGARIHDVVAACVYLAAVAGAQAQGTCSKPQAPACAVERGQFDGQAGYDQCRMQMLAYKGGMEGYADCLDQASRPTDGQSARDELEAILTTFNRKARGELQ
jgi:hypothetical protein